MFFPLPRRGRGKKHGFSYEPERARRKRRFSPGTDQRSVPGENERIGKKSKILFPLPRRGRGKKHANRKERQDFFTDPVPLENRMRFSGIRDGKKNAGPRSRLSFTLLVLFLKEKGPGE